MTRTMIVSTGAAILAILLTGTAAAQTGDAPGQRSCIGSPSDVSWSPVDDHTILATAGSRSFRVTTNQCPRLREPLAHIVVVEEVAGQICGPHDVRLYVSGPDRIPTPCFIQNITPLTKDEAKALWRR
jgi:hypothetical protein